MIVYHYNRFRELQGQRRVENAFIRQEVNGNDTFEFYDPNVNIYKKYDYIVFNYDDEWHEYMVLKVTEESFHGTDVYAENSICELKSTAIEIPEEERQFCTFFKEDYERFVDGTNWRTGNDFTALVAGYELPRYSSAFDIIKAHLAANPTSYLETKIYKNGEKFNRYFSIKNDTSEALIEDIQPWTRLEYRKNLESIKRISEDLETITAVYAIGNDVYHEEDGTPIDPQEEQREREIAQEAEKQRQKEDPATRTKLTEAERKARQEKAEMDRITREEERQRREASRKPLVLTTLIGSPLLINEESTKKFGIEKDGVMIPRVAIHKFDTSNINELQQMATKYLSGVCEPKVLYEADVHEQGLEGLKLADFVNIIDHELGVTLQAKVLEQTIEVDIDSRIIRLGNFKGKDSFIERVTKNIMDREVSSIFDKTEKRAEERVESLINGEGAMVTYSPNQPEYAMIGDVWFRENPDGSVDILVWSGEKWETRITSDFDKEVAAHVDSVAAQALEAQKAIEAFEKTLDTQIQNAGFPTLEEALTGIVNDADSFKAEVKEKFASQDGKITTEIGKAKDGLQVTINNLESSVNSRFTAMDGTIDSKISNANSKLNSQITQTINGVQTNIQNLEKNQASQFTQLSNMIDSKISEDEMESRITQAADQIDMTVSRTVENELAKIPQGAKVYPYNEPISPIDAMSKRMDEALPVDFTSERPNITIYQAQFGSACGRQDALQKMAESLVFPNTQIKGADGFIKYEAKGYLEYYREVASKVDELTGADVIVCTRVNGDSTYPRSWYDGLCYVEQAVSFEGGTLTRHSEPGTKGKSWSPWSLPNGDENIISRINLTAGGPVLSSGDNRLFVSPETTFIDDATIGSAHIKNASIGTAKISQIDAGNQRVVNITAANLAADKASFIEALFNGYYSNIKITGDKIQFYPNAVGDDAFSITINRKNIGFWLPDNNGRIGVITNTADPNDGLLMATTSQYYRLMLGYPDVNSYSYQQYGANDVGNYLYAISIHGRSGRITMHTAVTFNSGYTNNGSDIRLKEDIQTWDISAIRAIKDIQFIRFKYKKRQDDQKNEVYPVMYGLSAQSAPFISYERDDGYLTLDLEREQHLALKGVQELIEENEILKARVTSLEQRLEMMEEHLAKLEGGVLWK